MQDDRQKDDLPFEEAEDIIADVTAVFMDSLLRRGKSELEIIRLLGESSLARIEKAQDLLPEEHADFVEALKRYKMDKLQKAVRAVINVPRPGLIENQKAFVEYKLNEPVDAFLERDAIYLEDELPEGMMEGNQFSFSLDDMRYIFCLTTRIRLASGREVMLYEYPDYCEIRDGDEVICRFDPKGEPDDFQA